MMIPQSLERQFSSIVAPGESPHRLLARLKAEGNNNHLFISYLMRKLKGADLMIPVLPDVGLKLIQITSGDDYNFQTISRLISSDPTLSLNLLKFANSPLYRGTYPIHEIDQAIARIGMREVTALAISLYLKNRFIAPELTRLITRPLWKQAILTAIISEQLGKKYLIPGSLPYTLGLLHNVGALVILMTVRSYQKEHSGFLPDEILIQNTIETFQYRLSALVLYKWEFQSEAIETILKLPLPVDQHTPKIRKMLQFATDFSRGIFSGALKNLKQEQLKLFYHYLNQKSGLELTEGEQTKIINQSLKSYQETIQLFK